MSTQNICNICGANYEYRGGRWKCPACGAYKAEELSNEEVTLFYNAAQKLRLCDFDEAEKAYIDIIEKFPKNANGYWGRLLSRYGIKYEEDFDGRKIPTCYAASIESVLSDKDYRKALELADADTKAYFEQQAQYIERVRKEWIERAKKEKPYDIFICYKDSDLANGIDRTQDSIAAQDLYIHLTEQGYRVFFSRESLRDKVGEKYEPYIFNALSTAKVMLVYGTSSEYITSTWLKNEWTRYEKRLQAGEKKPNSLIVACDGFSPAELPKTLSSMQCFDATRRSFYTDLDVVLKRIIKGEKKLKPIITENKEKKKSKKLPVAIATISALITVFLCILIPNLLNTQPVTSIVDSKYGVVITAQEGVFDENTTVSVERLSDGTQYESLVSAVNDSKSIELQNAVIYDINCDADIDTKVTVKVSYAKNKAGSTVKVYYVSDDKATVEEHSCTYDNGSVEFKTTHFSYYVVGEIVTENDDLSDNQDKNNDNQNSSSIGGENTGDDITPPPPEVKEATINFNANGGSGSMSEQTVTVGKSTNLKECSYTKSGYIFSGWATSTGGSVVYTDGGAFVTESEKKITLYAIWVPNTNSLVFNSNGGSGAMNTVSIKTDETITLPVNTFNKTGYTFMGWSNIKNGAVVYTDSQSFTMSSSTTITLYAVWSANTNTINFNANGGSGTMASQQAKTGETITLRNNAFTRDGYSFLGWSTKATGSVEYTNAQQMVMGSASSTTLYAIWMNNSYSTRLNFTSNGDGTCYVAGGYSDSGEIVIPERSPAGDLVTSIGYEAFDDAYSLKSIKIPSSVTSIDSWAFSGCEYLTSVTFAENSQLTVIGEGAFWCCYSLVAIEIPVSVTTIGEDAFYCCSDLTNVYYGGTTSDWSSISVDSSNVDSSNDYLPNATRYYYSETVPTSYGNYWHYVDGVPTVWEPVVLTTFAYEVNSDGTTCTITDIEACMDTDIFIPEKINGFRVTCIGDFAFSGYSSLTSVTIPNSVTGIGNDAFWNCSSLTSITIPDSVTSIGKSAFSGCSSLISITIPDGVTNIGDYTFFGCSSLTSITIPGSVTNIGEYAFYDCSSLASITIPDGVTSIGNGMFYRCSSLTSIAIPDSVTSIGNEAFFGCNRLVSVALLDGVTSIGNQSFEDCSSLTSITIPDSVTSIGESAFYDCSSLTSITIPSGVTSIRGYAFAGCSSLIAVTISDGVKNINLWAFSGCSNLANVYYSATVAKWNVIKINSGNTALTNATIYYYSETAPTSEGNYWRYVEGIPTKW